jgi:hypothetical protein
MTRFILLVAAAFVSAFVGVSWASRGFPFSVPALVTTELAPLSAATFGDQSSKDYQRKMWEAEHTSRSDGDSKLDAIRMEALQAANAYSVSPCGETTKSNLIAAVTAYARAWQNKLDCPQPQNMRMFCSHIDAKMKEVAATFSTPLDIRVKAALEKAFDQRGIVKADFPADLQHDVLQFTGPGLWFDESPVCLPRMQAAMPRR